MRSETMTGRMIDANFEANTLTFEMYGGYYAATGKYVIVRESDYLSETEQRAELLEALEQAVIDLSNTRTNLMAEIGKGNDRWEGVPEILATRLSSYRTAIANATQQRNATGGEG